MWFPRIEAPNSTVFRATAFVNKSLTSMESHYSNNERKFSGILHSIEKFHHYCLAHETSMVTGYKPLVAIFKKDVTNLSYILQ